MSKICPECKTINEDGAEFCKNCGINLYKRYNSDESDNAIENRWVQILFYWPDTNGYRLAKSKIISEFIFILGFLYGVIFYLFIYDVELNLLASFIATIIIALIFSVPVFAIGFVLHSILSR